MKEEDAKAIVECMLGITQHGTDRMMIQNITEMMQALHYIDVHGVIPRSNIRDRMQVETPWLQQLRDSDCTQRVVDVRGLKGNPVTATMTLLRALDTNVSIEIIYACGFNTQYAGSLLREVVNVLRQTQHKVWALHLGDASALGSDDWIYLMTHIRDTRLATIGARSNSEDRKIRYKILQELNWNRQRMRWGRWDLTKHPDNIDNITTCYEMWWDPVRSNRNKRWLETSQWQDGKICSQEWREVEAQVLVWKFTQEENPLVLYPKGMSTCIRISREDPYGPVDR